MEIFFLDVGQGTCQVILLGSGRAIVIDCGTKDDRTVLRFLKRSGVTSIDRLIISHSHDDHIGGAVSILGDYLGSIERICFVQDSRFLRSAFWIRLSQLLKDGEVARDQLDRLEVTDRPQVVWMDQTTNARIQTYSPSFAENLEAQDADRPNPTSAVLFLDVQNKRVIFAADSEVAQWKEIHRKSGVCMKCDVLGVPHHAGRTHSTAEELDWLFDTALTADVAVISVGTNNTHLHPRADVIQAMTSRQTMVMCTQITKRCVRDLESIRPGVLKPALHMGRSSPATDKTSSGNSRNVACAGTIRIEIFNGRLTVDRLSEHQQAVDELPRDAQASPLCRNCSTSAGAQHSGHLK